ncbi:trypsin-like serine protease [Micromonospora sp. WMMD882]|uniref:trypsin-like serine peptidase n=1 Tax=Micromonospora sp. WMMD882 TaxID=3015151 RepID=UPI00248B2954|nr:trypsin-like serine protease [Micromonospora sp. WMMD882]WBB80126.1 trypsin-like serine protease [Micromonospora sp. WMMD882]
MRQFPVRRRVHAIALATATAAALLASGGSPASADPTTTTAASRAALERPTSNVAVPAPAPGAKTTATSSPSFAGTGVRTPSRGAAVDEGAPGVNSIIGADERYKINATTSYPYRAIALITFNGGRCTGWFYGPDVVGTAGHCLHSGGSGGAWSTNVVVYPGYTGTSAPYGSCTAKSLHSVSGWTSSANHEFDYGTIKLNCTLGNTVGWLGYFWTADPGLNGLPTRVCGYPGDKPLEQWCGDADNGAQATVVSVTAEKVYYRNDTVGGNSGAAVHYNRAGCGECSMAYHGYGGNPNSGKRITQATFSNMQYWTSLP